MTENLRRIGIICNTASRLINPIPQHLALFCVK